MNKLTAFIMALTISSPALANNLNQVELIRVGESISQCKERSKSDGNGKNSAITSSTGAGVMVVGFLVTFAAGGTPIPDNKLSNQGLITLGAGTVASSYAGYLYFSVSVEDSIELGHIGQALVLGSADDIVVNNFKKRCLEENKKDALAVERCELVLKRIKEATLSGTLCKTDEEITNIK